MVMELSHFHLRNHDPFERRILIVPAFPAFLSVDCCFFLCFCRFSSLFSFGPVQGSRSKPHMRTEWLRKSSAWIELTSRQGELWGKSPDLMVANAALHGLSTVSMGLGEDEEEVLLFSWSRWLVGLSVCRSTVMWFALGYRPGCDDALEANSMELILILLSLATTPTSLTLSWCLKDWMLTHTANWVWEKWGSTTKNNSSAQARMLP